ncbi:related to 60S ribosomal protein L33-B [Nakaseomyces glabratus]|nr:related to 60S ribosomal protein L33-B [Nakaseomyces glabratus]SLM14046.1 related to 60S ribosomal protein L33-B [Nakaseomyces glabratus]
MAESHRLYVKGKHLSYQRSKSVNNPNVSLLQIEGVANPQEAQFYLGKRVAYVYRASKEVRGSKIRVMWGKITRLTVTPVSLELSSETTCQPRLSVLPSESSCTHLTFKAHAV